VSLALNPIVMVRQLTSHQRLLSPMSVRMMPMSKCKIYRLSATIEGGSPTTETP
jgi:hypothetical protein